MSRSIVVFAMILAAFAATLSPDPASAAKEKAAADAPAHAAPSAVSSAGRAMMPAPNFALPGVPAWAPPAQYRVDMVMDTGKEQITMRRAFRDGSIRSEIALDDQTGVMIEPGDSPGTTITLMPDQKMAIKMNQADLLERAQKAGIKAEAPVETPDDDGKVEPLGAETVDGRAASKFRLTAGGRSMLAWFETATGAPVRMESDDARIEWKNLKVEPVAAKEFEVPKDYQLMDMGEQMKQMEKMGLSGGSMGAGAMASAAKRSASMYGGMGAGAPGMGGSMSVEGMAGQFGQSMGANMGASVGSSIGASFGGPLGAFAGQYIGGKVGGWIGHHAATAVTPDIGPGSGK